MTWLGLLPVVGFAAPSGEGPSTGLDEARALRAQGKYEEALQKHLWIHEHSLEDESAFVGVRLSYALLEWVELGAKYPKARESFLSVRDRDTKAITEGRGTRQRFQDVAAMNAVLKEDSKTVDLFLAVEAKQPGLACIVYDCVEDALFARREWKICARYVGDPMKRLERFELERQLQLYVATAKATPPVKEMAESQFVEQTCRLLEILVGAGRPTDAEEVRDHALGVRDDATIRSAMEKALQPKEEKAGAREGAAQSRPG